MDGIQTYIAPTTSAPARPAAPASPSHHAPYLHAQAHAHPNPAAAKSPSDYIRAVRRRIWLVLAIGVTLSMLSAAWAVRQPAVYQAKTQIKIEPPQYDAVVLSFATPGMGRRDPESIEKYLPNIVANLKNKALAEEVVNDPAFLQGAQPDPDAAEELAASIQARIMPNSNWVSITLEGTDPARSARQLTALIEVLTRHIQAEASQKNRSPLDFLSSSLDNQKRELKQLDAQILDLLQKTSSIGPDGKNIIQDQYLSMGSLLMHQKVRLSEIQQQAWVSKMFPNENILKPGDSSRLTQIERLQDQQRKLTAQLHEHKRRIRNFNTDPSVKATATKLQDVLDQLDQLRNFPNKAALDPSETIISSMQQEIATAEDTAKQLLGQLRESMPKHEQFRAMHEEREARLKQLAETQKNLNNLEMLSQYQNSPIKDSGPILEPPYPVRPKRALNILIGIVVSFGLGIALVCLLEHLDHSVKVPEHLTVGLTLPLLGVVPRIRRTALTHRGGHLWTPGTPDSVEADAYRNLRASLLGVSDRLGPIATLLVTSAKAGEGKSTTALNLAATFARAGERTLLMDVDLRRPSLGNVFDSEEPHDTGLVDVLKGELPWQKTVVRTDVPNLDFLPTGDAREIPIEVLGTIELRQLLIGLANHYDRVILDGPAVLGLADCRVLGRIVDAAVLVVRSGNHEMRPLQRAKAMLEQSGVVLAGVVFNGLYEDLQNWSSYGPYDAYGDGSSSGNRPVVGSSSGSNAVLPLVGAARD